MMNLFLLLAVANFATTSPAYAEEPRIAKTESCAKLRLAGNFQSATEIRLKEHYESEGRSYPISTFTIEQNDCQITVTETSPEYKSEYSTTPGHTHKLQFDLSGDRPTTLPDSIIAANEPGGAFAVQSLRSLKLNLISSEKVYLNKDYNYPLLTFSGTMNLPKLGSNAFSVDLKFEGRLSLMGPEDENEVKTINYIDLDGLRFRAVSASDPLLPGPLAVAFVMGANYILELADPIVPRYFNQTTQLTRVP